MTRLGFVGSPMRYVLLYSMLFRCRRLLLRRLMSCSMSPSLDAALFAIVVVFLVVAAADVLFECIPKFIILNQFYYKIFIIIFYKNFALILFNVLIIVYIRFLLFLFNPQLPMKNKITK